MAKRRKVKIHSTVSIPLPIAEKIKNRMENTGFTSVSSYVTYILREVFASMEEKERKTGRKEVFSKEEEEKVKARLRALGYLE